MTYPVSNNLYSTATGTKPSRGTIISTKDPTEFDSNYPLLQPWYNSSSNTLFLLTAFNTQQGVVKATWTVGGTPGTIASFVPDTGTSPVIPDGSSQVALSGGNNITTTGSTNTVAFDVTGTNNHSVQVGNASGSLTSIAVGSTGELLVGSSASDPAFGSSAAGNFSFNGSVAGGNRTFSLINADNTNAASNCISRIQVGGASAGSPMQVFDIASATQWTVGVNNVSSDAFVLAQSDAALGTKTTISATVAGEVSFPLQPAFFAHLPSSDANATGAGTEYLVGATTALTIDSQQGSNFTSAGVFTAPIAGWYLFTGQVTIDAVTAAMNSGAVFFKVGGNYFYGQSVNTANARVDPTVSDSVTMSVSHIIPLSALDTVVMGVNVANGAGDTASIRGGALTTQGNTTFAGIKIA